MWESSFPRSVGLVVWTLGIACFGVGDMVADSTLLVGSGALAGSVRTRMRTTPTRYSKTFDNLAVIPSNLQAAETASRFAKGLIGFAALVGPSGWGKTHILEASAGQLDKNSLPQVIPASEYAHRSHRLNPQAPLILDNVQDALSKTRTRIQLQETLRRRVRAGRPTMLAFTAPQLSRHLTACLPDQREWLVSEIAEPAASEREVVVRQIADDEGVKVSDQLINVLANRMKGDGRTLTGAVNRLKLADDNWLGPQKTLRACGLLKPFFADNSAWDLREHIYEVSEKQLSHLDDAFRRELLIYTMLREALVNEMEVAQFYEMEPARVYGAAILFWEKLQRCEHSQVLLKEFVEGVVDSLQR